MGSNFETTAIRWHLGFYGAAELELLEDRDILEFQREYNLSKEPLRMDLLVIKKRADRQIRNEIGRIFKMYNVIEYKSPDDNLSIDDYYKTVGYACLYKGLGDKVGEIPAEELTISIFRERYPRELFKEMRKKGFVIKKRFRGIYYVTGNGLFDTQVVVMKSLDERTHRSLRVLSPMAKKEDVEAFLRQANGLTGPGEKNNVEAVLQVSIQANRELYKEIRRRTVMCDALRELMKDVIEEEVVKERQEIIRNLMVNTKWTAEQAMSAMNIPAEEWGIYRAML